MGAETDAALRDTWFKRLTQAPGSRSAMHDAAVHRQPNAVHLWHARVLN